jgi:hypothetical protein
MVYTMEYTMVYTMEYTMVYTMEYTMVYTIVSTRLYLHAMRSLSNVCYRTQLALMVVVAREINIHLFRAKGSPLCKA